MTPRNTHKARRENMPELEMFMWNRERERERERGREGEIEKEKYFMTILVLQGPSGLFMLALRG